MTPETKYETIAGDLQSIAKAVYLQTNTPPKRSAWQKDCQKARNTHETAEDLINAALAEDRAAQKYVLTFVHDDIMAGAPIFTESMRYAEQAKFNELACRERYRAIPSLRLEFTSEDAFVEYCRAEAAGKVCYAGPWKTPSPDESPADALRREQLPKREQLPEASEFRSLYAIQSTDLACWISAITDTLPAKPAKKHPGRNPVYTTAKIEEIRKTYNAIYKGPDCDTKKYARNKTAEVHEVSTGDAVRHLLSRDAASKK